MYSSLLSVLYSSKGISNMLRIKNLLSKQSKFSSRIIPFKYRTIWKSSEGNGQIYFYTKIKGNVRLLSGMEMAQKGEMPM